METTYRKSLLSDKSELEKIILSDKPNIQNLILTGYNSTNIHFIISKAVSGCFFDQLFTVEYNGKIVGFVQFYGFCQYDSSIVLGYLLDKDYRGRGIMSKICNKLITKYFKSRSINKISTIIQKDNLESVKFVERLNFNFEREIVVKYFNIWRRKNKLVIYSVTKSDFINPKT